MATPDSNSQGNSRGFLAVLALLSLFGCGSLAYVFIGAPGPGAPGGSAAIGALKAIGNGQILYREGDKDGDGILNYAASLSDLTNTGAGGNEDLIDEVLARGTKQGYVFAITSASESGWTANADPAQPGVTGDRYFGANMEGRLFFSTTGPVRWNADGSSPDPELGR